MTARRICAVSVSAAALLGGLLLPLGAQAQGDNITSTPEARKLLRKMAEKRGGATRLSDIRSLVIETTRTLDAGTASQATYRILMPDRFKETGLATYTINRTFYWQRPQPRAHLQDVARQNKLKKFAEWSLLMLLRAPDVLPVSASVEPIKWQGRNAQGLRFVGPEGFDYTFIVAPDGSVLGFFHDDKLSSGGKIRTARRSVILQEVMPQAGLSFPKRLEETVGDYGARVVIDRLDLGAVLTDADFTVPR